MKRPFEEEEDERNNRVDNKKVSTDHNGRTRSFPHVKGNWATHFYAPVVFSQEQISHMTKLIDELNTSSINNYKIYLCEEYHLSLSKCFPIKRHIIEPLWQELKKSYKNITQFICKINSIKCFANDEQTRIFLAFTIDKETYEILNDLIDETNLCLKKYTLPTYYKDPTFHISFGWCLFNTEIDQALLESQLRDIFVRNSNDYGDFNILVNRLQLKCGNRVFTLKL